MGGQKYKYKSTVLFVRKYEAVNATAWATFFIDRMGRERVYVTQGLSLGHTTEEDAQSELDMFAAEHGLKGVKKR